jgi:hypothetical protein
VAISKGTGIIGTSEKRGNKNGEKFFTNLFMASNDELENVWQEIPV